MARPVIAGKALALLLLRVELTDLDAELGARLEDLRARAEERQVLVVGDLDETIEHGIVKHPPPVAVILLGCAYRTIAPLEIFRGDRRWRGNEIRADGAAGYSGNERQSQRAARTHIHEARGWPFGGKEASPRRRPSP